MRTRMAVEFARTVVVATLAMLAPALAADPYPSKPIRLVVGFGAGGPTDIPARFVADKLGDLLGKRVIVENKTGAAGMIATKDVLAQEPDGDTPLVCTPFRSITTPLDQNPAYKHPGTPPT